APRFFGVAGEGRTPPARRALYRSVRVSGLEIQERCMKFQRLLLAGALILPAAVFAVQAEKAAGKAPTVAEAKAFLDEAEAKLLSLATDAGRASWVQSNFITDDTEILAAQANERQISAAVVYAKKATRFDGVKLPDELARKMKLLKLSLTLATPSEPKESEELTRI